ncbi:hypothetical protein B0H11DRAFT_2082838 [Mycena galericulata]|nr:hypothetical protein B0H11DRAFT_2082838 [Mycena galericulata]
MPSIGVPKIQKYSPYERVSLPPNDFTRPLDLSPELVHHLFECSVHVPQCSHPMFRGAALRQALSSFSWQIHLLPPQLQVLAHCVIALSTSISFDHAILGPGPKPASFTDRSVFMRHADLRAYGVRRALIYRVLRAQALRLACEAGIVLEASQDNAVSCFLMQFLEEENEVNSRPWACAYLSHVRAIAGSWEEIYVPSLHTTVWTCFLMTEVLESTLQRKPVLVSHNDQLLITGMEPSSLQNLLASVQTALQGAERVSLENVVYTTLPPYLSHVTRLTRQLWETITGDFARRKPLDEFTVTEFLSALTLLHSIRSLLFDSGGDLDQYRADPLFHSSPRTRGADVNLRTCAYMMTSGPARLVLALHREFLHRASVRQAELPGGGQVALAKQWAAERLDLLRRQTHQMTGFAAVEFGRALRFLPSLPHLTHVERGGLIAWAQFCLDEADAIGDVGAAPEHTLVMQTISDALKLFGYSWPLPPGLVERLDAYVETHRSRNRTEPPAFVGENTLPNMFPEPLDDSWMAMLTMPYGNGQQGFAGGEHM